MQNDFRRWMSLCEASSHFRPGRFPAFLEKVYLEASTYLGIPPEEVEHEIDPESVREWIAHHRDLFRSVRITVYRAMALSEAQVAQLTPGSELGHHWSFELVEENFREFDISDATIVYVFEATVQANDVFFPLSVGYNCLFPHEKELFLHRSATPTLVSIRPYDMRTGTFGEPVRTDLTGATMRI